MTCRRILYHLFISEHLISISTKVFFLPLLYTSWFGRWLCCLGASGSGFCDYRRYTVRSVVHFNTVCLGGIVAIAGTTVDLVDPRSAHIAVYHTVTALVRVGVKGIRILVIAVCFWKKIYLIHKLYLNLYGLITLFFCHLHYVIEFLLIYVDNTSNDW